MENLIDGDLASNNGGWQWSASTGVDPCPYFRLVFLQLGMIVYKLNALNSIFNPYSQSTKVRVALQLLTTVALPNFRLILLVTLFVITFLSYASSRVKTSTILLQKRRGP